MSSGRDGVNHRQDHSRYDTFEAQTPRCPRRLPRSGAAAIYSLAFSYSASILARSASARILPRSATLYRGKPESLKPVDCNIQGQGIKGAASVGAQ
jgi:hypothetical protein